MTSLVTSTLEFCHDILKQCSLPFFLQQAALEAQKRRSEMEKSRITPSANGDAPRPAAGSRMTKAGGWLPSADAVHSRSRELDDPLLQQIDNIESFLRQARAANRSDEISMLEENLRQLQDEFDAQQTTRAIELSQRLAEEESLQQSQIQYLQQREMESKRPTRKRSLDFGDKKNTEEHEEKENDSKIFNASPVLSPLLKTQSLKSFPPLPGNSPPLQRDERTPALPAEETQNSDASASLNPFDNDDATPVEEDPTNPFSEEVQKEHNQASSRKDQEYNPFSDEENGEKEGIDGAPGNPFEDDDDDKNNPFKETSHETSAASTNPFDEDDDDGPALDDVIEEELLLQQIDNIRAYIFDAKLSGRTDEVELLSQNLRELQCTLQEQKRKTH